MGLRGNNILRELVSKKYYVRNLAYGYLNGRHNLSYGTRIYVYLHQFKGTNVTFWDEEINTSYEKFSTCVDAYAAIQRVENKDRNGDYRLWNFGPVLVTDSVKTSPDRYEIIEEKIYREIETSVIDNGAVIAEYQLFNQQMTQDLKDQFVSIKPISDTGFIQVVKKENDFPEMRVDIKTVIEQAKRMAEMAGFDGPIEGMLEDE